MLFKVVEFKCSEAQAKFRASLAVKPGRKLYALEWQDTEGGYWLLAYTTREQAEEQAEKLNAKPPIKEWNCKALVNDLRIDQGKRKEWNVGAKGNAEA